VKRVFAVALALLASAAPIAAKDADTAEADRILERYEQCRPSQQELAFFQLDWARDLDEAKTRAKKEKRPIFFIWLTNKSGPTRFFSGHC
jgi:predicted component of type VI protein secretion system